MNVHDTARMVDVLRPFGYRQTHDPQKADVLLVNTCSVREKSRQKVLSTLGRFAPLKQARPELIVGVAGCVAQQEGQQLLKLAPSVDLVFSPDHLADLPQLLARAAEKKQVLTGFSDVEEYRFLTAETEQRARTATALVTIQKGCDNRCAYCIVPSVRGPEVSRPAEEVVDEVTSLVQAGVREVTLIGQNVNSYKGISGKSDDFVRLLRRVDAVPGLCRLRFTTSNPKDFHPGLAAAYGELATLCAWLHLPVQSGSSAVLAAMNRGYDRTRYLEIIESVRAVEPRVSVGTDIIVGFPGERESDFLETVSLIEEIRFDYSYSFKYSVRPGTAAAAEHDDVPEEEKSRRLRQLQKVQDSVTRRQLAGYLGHDVEVLVEGPSRRGPPQMSGRAPGNQVVNFNAEPDAVAPGDRVTVAVERAGGHSLFGRLLSGSRGGAQ